MGGGGGKGRPEGGTDGGCQQWGTLAARAGPNMSASGLPAPNKAIFGQKLAKICMFFRYPKQSASGLADQFEDPRLF